MRYAILRGREIAPILRMTAKKTVTTMSFEMNASDSTWRAVSRGEKHNRNLETRMMQELRESADVFWTDASDATVAFISNASSRTMLHDAIGGVMDTLYVQMAEVDPASVVFVSERSESGGADIFGTVYGLALYYKLMASAKSTRVKPHEASRRFKKLSGLLVEMLDRREDKDPLANILRFYLWHDRFTARWVDTPGPERASQAWIERIDTTQFFETVISYNTVVPKAWPAVWNALSIASRQHRREKYEDLYQRILKSKRFKDIDGMRAMETYDEDFTDFERWFETRHIAAA